MPKFILFFFLSLLTFDSFAFVQHWYESDTLALAAHGNANKNVFPSTGYCTSGGSNYNGGGTNLTNCSGNGGYSRHIWLTCDDGQEHRFYGCSSGLAACASGKNRNSITGLCQTPPTCKIAETYDNATNSCIAPVCTAPQINDAITGACIDSTIQDCTGTQSPLTVNCQYPTDKGTGINCADGSTVYVPMVCPDTGSRWEDVFPSSKPMCSPLATDHTNCTPTLFQRMDDFASSHAIQYATAALALATMPALAVSSELATIVSGVGVEARAMWDGVFHNSAGEVVDVKVSADVPKTVMGDALADFIKKNPTAPYSSQFPAAYNAAAPHAPVVVDPNTGVIRPANSTVPFSSNQLYDAAKQLGTSVPVPYSQLAPYITPERIPWLTESVTAMNYDLSHQQTPANYPQLIRTTNPLQSSSPYYQVSPNPLSTAPLFPPSTPQSITGIQPFSVFRPSSPVPLVPPPLSTTQLPSNFNPNPDGTDSPTSPLTSPDPTMPIDPAAADVPPVPPEIFPDTYQFFDFLPMSNPFSFDVHDFIPALPEPTCYYEIHRTFHVPLLGNKSFDLAPCEPLQPLRTVLAWVFSVLSLFTCFFIIFRSSF